MDEKNEIAEGAAEVVPEPLKEIAKPDRVDIKKLFDIPEIEETNKKNQKNIETNLEKEPKKKRGRPAGIKNKPKVVEVPVFEKPVKQRKLKKETQIVQVVRAPTSEEITAWHAEQISDKRRKCLSAWAEQVARSFA